MVMIMTFTCGAGHGGHSDCASNIAAEIECCKVTEGTLTSTDCEILPGDAGEMLSCAPKGMFLQGVCGSFNNTSCFGSSHNIRCCKYFLDETITGTPNRRMYPVEVGIEPSTNGYDSRCSSGKIAVGRCASGATPGCSVDYTLITCAHGAPCIDCPLT
ncbi:unnamed protein product [Darwinula stevensoni]|uniref:Uncharacterized protein n=1 Tax=Darwinula stevensoni TaxID=69355 RepID=A0A7R9A7E8_9CRUS|nr:unnamed protein product [Darwinula stevensoni]CAG0891489.1 unnamed protein product [Darwinula stevensoni]